MPQQGTRIAVASDHVHVTVAAPFPPTTARAQSSAALDATRRTPTRRLTPAARQRLARKESRKERDRKLEQEIVAKREERRQLRQQAREERSRRRAAKKVASKGRLTVGKQALIMLAVAAVGLAIVYPSARTYYITERNNERLSAELAAIQTRHDQISEQIAALSTNEGVEDEARTELGWVRSDESAVVVSGINADTSRSLPAAVSTATISAPTTWYTRVRDALFFVDTSKPVVVDSYSGDPTGGSATNPAA